MRNFFVIRMNKSACAFKVFACAALPAALIACSKPPDCADPGLAATLQEMITGKLGEVARSLPRDDPNYLTDHFLSAVKFDIEAVVSDGYDSGTQKQMCRANVAVSTPDGKTEKSILAFTLQKEAKNGGTTVWAEDTGPVLGPLAVKLDSYYEAHRFGGNWIGTYACEGANAEEEEGDRPFSRQVTMNVVNRSAKLERTTADGGFEKLAGTIGENKTLTLTGAGRSPDVSWKVTFEGAINGNTYSATGVSQQEGRGTEFRQCELKLEFLSGR